MVDGDETLRATDDGLTLAPRPVDQPTRRSAAQEFHVTPDGKTAAILMTDYLRTYWWVAKSQD